MIATTVGAAKTVSFAWVVTVPVDLNITDSEVFFLMGAVGDSTQWFPSHYFNITKRRTSTTSSSSSSSSVSPASQINTEIRIMASVECHVPGFYVVSMSASPDTFLNDKRSSVHIHRRRRIGCSGFTTLIPCSLYPGHKRLNIYR